MPFSVTPSDAVTVTKGNINGKGEIMKTVIDTPVQTAASRAIVFSGMDSLNRLNVRMSLLRIPEVGLSLKEFQSAMDQAATSDVSLKTQMMLDDEAFVKAVAVKNVCVAAVLKGLFARYLTGSLKKNSAPNFLIGPSQRDSVLHTIVSGKAATDFVLESLWYQEYLAEPVPRESVEISVAASIMTAAPQINLMGLVLSRGSLQSEMSLYKSTEDGGFEIVATSSDLNSLVKKLYEDYGVTDITSVGPQSLIEERLGEDPIRDLFSLSDSIESDPMLGWFKSQSQSPGLRTA